MTSAANRLMWQQGRLRRHRVCVGLAELGTGRRGGTTADSRPAGAVRLTALSPENSRYTSPAGCKVQDSTLSFTNMTFINRFL